MRLPLWTYAIVLVGCVGLPRAGKGQEPPADLVMLNGHIVTMDDGMPQAEALAARHGKIVAIGRSDDVRRWVGPRTRTIDLVGKFAMPGFIESHGHFVSLGQAKMVLDLTRARTWDDIVRQVEEAANKTPAGEWITGRGWHQEKWSAKPEPNVEGYPVHDGLSAVTSRNPVVLTHASGHMSFANAVAMKQAGIDARTTNPAGGEILKDAGGNPTGVFRETAQGLLDAAQGRRSRSPEERRRDFLTAVRLAETECLSKGVTSFQDAGSGFETIDALKKLAEEGKLAVRLWVMIRASNEEMTRKLRSYRMIGVGDDHLTVRAIKRSLDGALGPHGAWLLEPYEDLRSSMGLNTMPLAALRETARLARENDYQLCVHAIGDRANREALNIFEDTLGDGPDRTARRWRIEHAQHLLPDDIGRFAKLGIIASMQGIHCTSDAVYVLQRLGPKRAQQGAYVWRSLLQSGAVVTNGTDAPVEDVDPIASYHASVTRRLSDGRVFFPEQKMTREEALRSYTRSGAYAAFEESIKGTLTLGKLADIVVLSQNLLTVPDEKLLQTRVLLTIVGGRVLYEAK